MKTGLYASVCMYIIVWNEMNSFPEILYVTIISNNVCIIYQIYVAKTYFEIMFTFRESLFVVPYSS